MGYARLEQQIRKDTQADQPLGRHILWKEARVNKDGVVDNENVKKVVELCETIEQSSETQEGNKDTCRDILGKVFNVPEYSGRVRGKGFGVTPKSFFPQEKRQKPSNEEVLEKLRILSEQVALLVNTNKDKQLPVQLQPEIQMESETGSCNVGLKSIPEKKKKPVTSPLVKKTPAPKEKDVEVIIPADYPRLIREFYANFKLTDDGFKTQVKVGYKGSQALQGIVVE
ncbi:uncharacterized protein [Cicer arietinum]|uniref:uncharacterized protein n=1 Tax=Cicer arietinum TaxID=3827 RepID=UPI003CC524AE